MKIVTRGTKNQVTCPSCRSVLEFEPHDVSRKNTGRDDDGDELHSYSILCPVCKGSISVSQHITSAMRSRVDEVKNRDSLED